MAGFSVYPLRVKNGKTVYYTQFKTVTEATPQLKSQAVRHAVLLKNGVKNTFCCMGLLQVDVLSDSLSPLITSVHGITD